MVGGYALRYALEHLAVKGVIGVGRRNLGILHPKLEEVLHRDFMDCSARAKVLSDQEAVVFCLGAYTGVVPDAELRKITVNQTIEFARQLRLGLVVDIITAQLRLIRTLRGLTPDFVSFNDAAFDEDAFEQHLAEEPGLKVAACWYWIRKLQARFFAGAYTSAIGAAANARPLLSTTPGFFEVAEYELYLALARAALCDTAPAAERARHQEALATHHRQLEEWAENCPANFEDRAALVGAEVARIDGRTLDAEQLYEKAIRSARANGFVHNEAVANELAARFYAARGFETTSHVSARSSLLLPPVGRRW